MTSDIREKVKESTYKWCEKYLPLFQRIASDEELRSSLRTYSAYGPYDGDQEILRDLRACFEEAYDSKIIVKEYWEIIEESGFDQTEVGEPTIEWVDSLNSLQIMACIAWHFRRDHFDNGCLINDSVANGYMLIFVKGFMKKYSEEQRRG